MLHRKWTLSCVLCTHQKSYKLDKGIMLIFVSEKNRPLLLAKGVYMTCIFVYQCLRDNIPNFHNFYVYNSDIHAQNTRQASDLHVTHDRLDVRRASMKTHGANIWNSIPLCVKESTSIEIFKQRLRKYLIDQKLFPHYNVHNWCHIVFWLYRSKWLCMLADFLKRNKLRHA